MVRKKMHHHSTEKAVLLPCFEVSTTLTQLHLLVFLLLQLLLFQHFSFAVYT